MNQEFAVDFEWFKCPQGYRIVSAKEFNRAHGLDPDFHPDDDSIFANSLKRTPYRPLDGPGSLITVFAHVKTREDLLKFMNQYGPLADSNSNVGGISDWGDSISECLSLARDFRDLLLCKSKGPKKVAAVFDAQSRTNFIANRKAFRITSASEPTREDLTVSIGSVDLVPDPARGVRLKLTTGSLIGAIWWQLGLKLFGATIFRQCRQCGKPFEAGPGAEVRADAKFCCREHSVLFHSLRRSKGA